MAETAIETRVTEAGPVEAVAATMVGTAALPVAVFAIEALGAAVLTAGPTDSQGTAASPCQGVTGTPILAFAGKAAVLSIGIWRTSLIADKARPAIRAVTAIQTEEAGPSILTVITGQATVRTKGSIQTDELLFQHVLAPGLCLLLRCHIIILEEPEKLILQHSHVRKRPHRGQLAIQVHL